MQSTLDKQHELLRLIVQKMEIRSEADQQDEGAPPDSRHQLTVADRRPLSKKLAAVSAFRSMPK